MHAAGESKLQYKQLPMHVCCMQATYIARCMPPLEGTQRITVTFSKASSGAAGQAAMACSASSKRPSSIRTATLLCTASLSPGATFRTAPHQDTLEAVRLLGI